MTGRRKDTRRKRVVRLTAVRLILTVKGTAAVRYVDVSNTNPAPLCTSWATAATNIQDAVDAANPGDQISHK